jgi:hypothetical protein
MTQLSEFETAQGRSESAHSLVREPATTPWRLTQAEQREFIRAALDRDPALPDLRVAVRLGVPLLPWAGCARLLVWRHTVGIATGGLRVTCRPVGVSSGQRSSR